MWNFWPVRSQSTCRFFRHGEFSATQGRTLIAMLNDFLDAGVVRIPFHAWSPAEALQQQPGGTKNSLAPVPMPAFGPGFGQRTVDTGKDTE
jgi:hypothetical protein